MFLAPPGFHWECVGFACVPLDSLAPPPPPPPPVCQAARKASDGKRCACQMRACCDLAERNARLMLGGTISHERFQVLSEDLRAYCPVAWLYEQSLLQHPELPLRKGRQRCAILRKTLKERKAALQKWLQQAATPSSSS